MYSGRFVCSSGWCRTSGIDQRLGRRKAPRVEGSVSTTLLRFAAEARTYGEQQEIQARLLEEMCRVIPGKAAGVYLLGSDGSAASSVLAHGVSEYFLARYEHQGRDSDPVLQAVLTRRSAVTEAEISDPAAWMLLPLYRQVLALHSIAVIDADIDSKDYFPSSPAQVEQRIMAKLGTRRSGIILMHDIHARTIAMLPGLLDALKARGYKVVHLAPASRLGPFVASLSADMAYGYGAGR